MEKATNNRDIFIIILVCILCYYNSCFCEFTFDDMTAIRDNKDIRSSSPITNIFYNDFWGTRITKEHSHKSYRPITVLTFRWNYAIHELDPFGYHFVNVVLHIIVCLLFKKLTDSLLDYKISFFATIFFTVHPIHTEAVTGVVGRAEILSSIFYLTCILFYIELTKQTKRINFVLYFFLYTASLTLAMFSKEQGITASGICFVYEMIFVQNMQPKLFVDHLKSRFRKQENMRTKLHNFTPQTLGRLICITIVIIILLFIRMYIMGSHLPVFTRFDNPASVEKFPAKHLTLNYLVFFNLLLLIFPSNLCCDWTMGSITIIKDIFDPRNVCTLMTYLVLFQIVVTIYCSNGRNLKGLSLGLSMMVLPFIPASNLFFPVGFVVAERILYMPSMGFCIIVAKGLDTLMKQLKSQYFQHFALLLILIFGLKTHNRNFDWKSEYSLFTAGIRINGNNAKLFNNVGHALENIGSHEEALEFFKKAVEIQHDDIGAYINVGRAYKNLKQYSSAEMVLQHAKSLLPSSKIGKIYRTRIAPNDLNVFLNLASLISQNETRLEEADLLYKQAINMRSDYVQAYINRGDILMKLNRSQEALEVYQTALQYENDNADIYYNIGVVLVEQGKSDDAISYFEKAIKENPYHEQALLNSAILIQESGKLEKLLIAKNRFLRLLEMNENNDRVHFNLAMLAMDDNQNDDAVKHFQRSIVINPSFKSALFNLALLLSDNNRSLEAMPFLKQLLFHHPNHIKALILLGDIYMNELKDIDSAETCYKTILSIDPENVQGFHNLCVVYVERNQLKKALECLEDVHALAPNVDYVRNHLQIIQNKLKKL